MLTRRSSSHLHRLLHARRLLFGAAAGKCVQMLLLGEQCNQARRHQCRCHLRPHARRPLYSRKSKHGKPRHTRQAKAAAPTDLDGLVQVARGSSSSSSTQQQQQLTANRQPTSMGGYR